MLAAYPWVNRELHAHLWAPAHQTALATTRVPSRCPGKPARLTSPAWRPVSYLKLKPTNNNIVTKKRANQSHYHTVGGSRPSSRPASRPASRPSSRPASRQGSKPPSRYGSTQSLDGTDHFCLYDAQFSRTIAGATCYFVFDLRYRWLMYAKPHPAKNRHRRLQHYPDVQ